MTHAIRRAALFIALAATAGCAFQVSSIRAALREIAVRRLTQSVLDFEAV